jgi:ribosomal protein L32E
MLLKTHVEKMSALELAKISMKTKEIDRFCQDMYEKKGTWVKPESKTEMGRASMNPSPRAREIGHRQACIFHYTGRSACVT